MRDIVYLIYVGLTCTFHNQPIVTTYTFEFSQYMHMLTVHSYNSAQMYAVFGLEMYMHAACVQQRQAGRARYNGMYACSRLALV